MAKDQGIKPLTWRCRLFGHKPTGEITGFRNTDRSVITRCRFCNTPIVVTSWYASVYVSQDLKNEYERQDRQWRYEQECG